MATNTKDLILGAKVPVPIDSSLQGAPQNGNPAIAQAMSNENNGAATAPPMPSTGNANGNSTPENVSTANNSQVKPVSTGPDWEKLRDMNSQQIFDYLQNSAKQYAPPSEEELARQRKRQKRAALFAAIGDGVSALSNLYFTTKGAPSIPYDPQNTMSARNRERYERLKKEHEDNREKYFNILARMNDISSNETNWRHQIDREKLADSRWDQEFGIRERQQKRLEDEVEIKRAISDARINQYDSVQSKNEAQAAYWEAKANALERGLPLDQALKEAKIAKEKALADKARRNGGGGKSDNGMETVETKTTDRRNNTVTTVKYKRPRQSSPKTSSPRSTPSRSGGGKWASGLKL